MQATDKKYLNKFINADDEANIIADGEILSSTNMRFASTDEGFTGRWENILSNAEIANTYLPDGENTDIGICSSDDTNYIIQFVYNSNGDHGIYTYRKTNSTFYKVLLNSQVTGGLNFAKNSPITARIIGNLVYFTDNSNEPRRVNIESGIKLNHPAFDTTQRAYTSPLEPAVITVIRKPPSFPLVGTKTTAAVAGITINNNNVKEFSGRFAWFYTYKDGEVSAISEHSHIIPYNSEGESYDVVSVAASASETIEQDVQKVTFVVIYADGEQGFEIKTWDKDNSDDLTEIANHNSGLTPLTYKFTNSEVGAAVDAATLVKPFDAVPLKAKTLERSGGRLFLGNILSGYTAPKTTSLTAATVTSTTARTAIKMGSSRRIGIVFYDKYMRNCGVVPYSKLVTVANRGVDYPLSFQYAVQWALSNTNAANEIPDWAYYYSIVSTKDITRSYFLQAYAGEIFYSEKDDNGDYSFTKTEYSTTNAGIGVRLNILNGSGMGYSFSEGDLINLTVNNGTTTTATLSVIGVYGDFLLCSNYNFGTLDYSTTALFETYTPNNKTTSNYFYEQGNLYAINSPTLAGRTYGTLSGYINGDVYLIRRSILNQLTYNFGLGSTKSDEHTLKCTFVSSTATPTKYTTGNSTLTTTAGFNPNTDNTRWIIKTFSSSVKFNIKGSITMASAAAGNYKIWLEVNDGSTTTEQHYLVPSQAITAYKEYEFEFNTDVTVPANSRVFVIAWFTDGASGQTKWYKEGSMVISTLDDSAFTTFECMSPNDKFYKNWFTDAGRLQIISDIGQQTLRTAVRWSETIVDGTRTNGLSSFDALNQKLLPHELEEINKLQLANKVDEQGQGNVMLAICPSEVASMYLGEVQLMGAAQAGDIATTDNVIGSVNVLKGSYGTIHPESVVEFKGNVWWFDALSGRFAQYSVNGVDDISSGENDSFKFARVAKQLASKILSMTQADIEALGSRPFVFAGVDPYHMEVYWTIPKLGDPPKGFLSDFSYASSVPEYLDTLPDGDNYSVPYPYDILDFQNTTLVYKIGKRWMGKFTLSSEGFTTLDATPYSVKNGKLYKHNVAGSYNTFYGTQYRSKIALVCNKENTIKEFQSVAIEGSLPEWVHLRSEEPSEQSTDIVASDFEDKEGVYYAPVLKDRLTPNADSVEQAQISGDEMRTKALRVLVQWNSDALIYLRTISFGYNQSSGHY